jgi:hypothetical protein
MFTIFGFGNKNTIFPIPNSKTNEGSAVQSTINYFHIWWLLRVTFGRKWSIINITKNPDGSENTNEKKVSYKEAVEAYGGNIVKPWWFIFNQSIISFLVLLTLIIGIAIANPAPIKPLNAQTINSTNVWTTKEEEYMAEFATDEESQVFANKFKKVDKLNAYLKLRALKQEQKKLNNR